ncbi:MAG: nitrate reductase cytochrome c-type subunit; periplasmic nitrate reductase electron transfer subunit [Gammaproteobacteria bacterium]|nr:nitrate reductase cytochrome c-type subunit; periplasmic nitrate reductase electron transfer subunit [Gammaproteobacteria bacterium]
MKTLFIKIKYLLLLSITALALQTSSVSAEQVYSLRGTVGVDEISEMVPNRRSMAVDGGIEVSFEDQPPMIPHNIDKTRITLHENSCLSCHSKKNQKITNAVRPPKSHYRTREGDKLRQISTGRYFCTQCHVPQAYTKPLVKNDFTN